MPVVISGPLAVAGSRLNLLKKIGVSVPSMTASIIERISEIPIKTERVRLL